MTESRTRLLARKRDIFAAIRVLEGDLQDGIIDEATVYNRALSDSEVKALFNAGSAGKCAPIPTIPLNGTAPLTFAISNTKPANVALTGVAFTDTLPSGLVVATPNGLTGSCGGGTITATAGGSTISLSGGSLAAGASCTFGVSFKGASGGEGLGDQFLQHIREGEANVQVVSCF